MDTLIKSSWYFPRSDQDTRLPNTGSSTMYSYTTEKVPGKHYSESIKWMSSNNKPFSNAFSTSGDKTHRTTHSFALENSFGA